MKENTIFPHSEKSHVKEIVLLKPVIKDGYKTKDCRSQNYIFFLNCSKVFLRTL